MEPSQAATTPVLPAELLITEAAALRARLLEALAAAGPGGTLRIDGASVEAVDGAGLSLLCALAAELRARGGSLSVISPSAPLVAAASLAGAGALLGLGAA